MRSGIRVGGEPLQSISPRMTQLESQRAVRVLYVRPLLEYTELGVCVEESSSESRVRGVAALRGGDTSTGSTAETSITPAMMCSARRYVPSAWHKYAIRSGPNALAKPQAVSMRP